MKKAISVLMIAACMLCMVTACEKKNKKGNDTSAVQATETDCTAAELVTTEPQGEITISEMIDQRIKEEGKIMIYRMHFGPSKTPLEITEDLNVNIISYDGEKLTGYDNPDDFLMETRLGDIIHNKVDYSTYNIGAYGGKDMIMSLEMKNMWKKKAMYSAKSLQMIRKIMPSWRHCICIQRELFIAGMLEVKNGTRQRKTITFQ